MCLITFDKFLTKVKLFHVYIKVHKTTSDIGHKPAISNIFNRFEYISSVVWNKYLVVHLASICTTFWTGKNHLWPSSKRMKIPKNCLGPKQPSWAIMSNIGHITGPLLTRIIQSLYYALAGRCINAWMHSLKKSVKPEIVNRYDLWVLRHRIRGVCK